MTSPSRNWVEVWVDETASPPYVLMVQPDDSDPPNYLVHDPKENYKIVFTSRDYEEVRLWLLEDEYVRVEGRTQLIEEGE